VFAQLVVTAALVASLTTVAPPDYSEKGLCDLWAGARCHATSCLPDAKQRCEADSRRCRGRGGAAVSPARAEKVAACARALLQARCGDPAATGCDELD
jgi:hypothetical protein